MSTKNKAAVPAEASTVTETKATKASKTSKATSRKVAKKDKKPEVGLEYQPYDVEAWEYMRQASIPGAYAPILYIGEKVSEGVAKILGRSMTLEEAKYLVGPDGDPVTCSSEGIEFQPIRYLPFVPRSLDTQIKEGRRLTEIDLPFGGAFYVNRNNEITGFSGTVYHYVAKRQRYEWNSNSPLVMVAEELGRQRGQIDWGVTYEHAIKIQTARLAAIERRGKIGKLAKELISNRPDRHAQREDRVPDWRVRSVAGAFADADTERNRRNGRKPYNRSQEKERLETEVVSD